MIDLTEAVNDALCDCEELNGLNLAQVLVVKAQYIFDHALEEAQVALVDSEQVGNLHCIYIFDDGSKLLHNEATDHLCVWSWAELSKVYEAETVCNWLNERSFNEDMFKELFDIAGDYCEGDDGSHSFAYGSEDAICTDSKYHEWKVL